MNYGLHILKTPNNKFTFVGSVPVSLMDTKTPTVADVMGGRVHDGKAYFTKVFLSVEQAVTAAKEAGATLCTAKNCACRRILNPEYFDKSMNIDKPGTQFQEFNR